MTDKISNLSLSNRQSKHKSKKATSKVDPSTRILEDQRKAICLGMGVSGIGVCGSLNYIQIHNHTKLTTLILENISKSKSRFIHRDPEAQGHNLDNWLEVSSDGAEPQRSHVVSGKQVRFQTRLSYYSKIHEIFGRKQDLCKTIVSKLMAYENSVIRRKLALFSSFFP